MAAERIPACACHIVRLAAANWASVVQEVVGRPGVSSRQALSVLLDQALQDIGMKLRVNDLQAIMGPWDPVTDESFSAASLLSHEAIDDALKQRSIWDRRRSSRTRIQMIVNHANAYISSWSRDRGMDLEEVQRLQAKGVTR